MFIRNDHCNFAWLLKLVTLLLFIGTVFVLEDAERRVRDSAFDVGRAVVVGGQQDPRVLATNLYL